jgi:hypothetical protein
VILGTLDRGECEAVVTHKEAWQVWRGIPKVDLDLHRAIADSYEPFCTAANVLVHLRRSADDADTPLATALTQAGCELVLHRATPGSPAAG